LIGNTVDLEYYQRLARFLYVRAGYRVHHQTGVDFFYTSAPFDARLRTSDSDLAEFVAQTVSVLAALDLGFWRRLRELHVDVGYDRYFRSNNLRANIYTCSLGFRF
jgi:hypothetical protein